MTSHLTSNSDRTTRALDDDELGAVTGGTTISPGYGPARLNISPWSILASHDPMWDLVGVTGHLPG
jgi:hypothetical protein